MTLTGVDDSIVDGAVVYSIITAVTESTDPKYDRTINPADVSVTNIDNDASIKLWDADVKIDTPFVDPAQAVLFASKLVTLNFSTGDTAVLSSTPEGTGPILADNFITINNIIRLEPVTPISAVDISAFIPNGQTPVLFEWRDFGGIAQSSDIFLVTSAEIVG